MSSTDLAVNIKIRLHDHKFSPFSPWLWLSHLMGKLVFVSRNRCNIPPRCAANFLKLNLCECMNTWDSWPEQCVWPRFSNQDHFTNFYEPMIEIWFDQILILMIQSGHDLHMSWQLSCDCYRCRFVTWYDNHLSGESNSFCDKIGLWSHNSL